MPKTSSIGRAIPGRSRTVIESVRPELDCGRFAIKRVIGESVVVEADIFTDGHDLLTAVLLYRVAGEPVWTETEFRESGNDRWRAAFEVTRIGRYEYSVEAWVDRFKTWRRDLQKRLDARVLTDGDLEIGARIIEEAAGRARGEDRKRLHQWAEIIRMPGDDSARLALTAELAGLMARYPERAHATRYGRTLPVVVDRERARFSAWYELFPRSTSRIPGRHGTFEDVKALLPRIADLGFDVLYLPPIHPIGRTNRKGKNNELTAGEDELGSPWAIGSDLGGHKSIHPELGTLEDFRSLVSTAARYGIEVAMDVAFQCSPDHPYAREHEEWFLHRPDGTIQYAENPPKKYEDIYPFDFETEAWPELWEELKSVFVYWIEQGVRIFRVDNPHTKPFRFWEWLISELKAGYPDLIFLSEAFTRPKVMYRLAKLGFSQSYTYFPWRNTAWEIRQYHSHLTRTEVREYFRPNSWPNTPDILTEYLQTGGRPAFLSRLVLAATLSASYGVYGTAFEACEQRARFPGSEEYLDSEKYQIRQWHLEDQEENLTEFLRLVNRIRRENPALHRDWNLSFHDIDNPQLICYSKCTDDLSNIIIVVVNVDPHHVQSGWMEILPRELGLEEHDPYQAHDLISGARYLFHGFRNYVSIDPARVPAHIFRVRRKVRSEVDFEYFL
jgi:starch synthase (maltosyl-transferring)